MSPSVSSPAMWWGTPEGSGGHTRPGPTNLAASSVLHSRAVALSSTCNALQGSWTKVTPSRPFPGHPELGT